MTDFTKAFGPGSNRWTLASLILLLATSASYKLMPVTVGNALLLISGILLVLNFLLGLVRKHILLNKLALLVFHLSLLLLFLLLIVSQLTYLKGTVEVGVNQEFSGQIENIRAGSLHDYQLSDKRFTNLGFKIAYHEGVRRHTTHNSIVVSQADGSTQLIEIGDHVPLVIGHYRFYTSHNKGYSPVFSWKSATGPALRGSVNLPAYPLNEYKQSREWTLPGGQKAIWTMLVIEEDVIPEDRDFSFRVPAKHHLIVRIGEQRWKLLPGEQIELPDGILKYDYLSSWMGYTVDYDWVRPWLLATALIGIFSIALHYLSRMKREKLSFSGNQPSAVSNFRNS
jgi:hypothetical protein